MIQEKMREDFDKMNTKDVIEKLSMFFLKSKDDRLRFILKCFMKNRNNIDPIKRLWYRLLDCTSGQALVGFKRWSAIPDRL